MMNHLWGPKHAELRMTRIRGTPEDSLLFLVSEVAFSGSRDVTAVVAIEVDWPERAVGFEVGGGVGERVLAAQFFLDVLEAGGHLLNGWREEDLSAGVACELRQ